jgi:hypothetical protein
MANPTIPYQDLGNFILARSDQSNVQSAVNTMALALLNNLNSIIIEDTTQPPVCGATNPVYVNPTTNQPDIIVTYQIGDGLFPTASFLLYLAGPAGSNNVEMNFDVEFFDYDQITVTAQGVPSVTGRFDVTNISRKALNALSYGVLGVALQVWLDSVSDSIYNGTTS